MKTPNNKSLVIAFIVIVALFLLFSGGAMSGEIMNGGFHGSGWMGERTWMRTPALLTLVIGFVLGWAIFKKKE